MADEQLTTDQKRMLILISKFTKPAKKRDEEETWIKKIPLQALVHRGIQLKIFVTYDFAPQLVEYMGSVRYASISKEGEDDVADLRELGYVERLKLATSHHVYVSAYRTTPKGMEVAANLEKKHHDAVEKLIQCTNCKSETVIESKEDAPYLMCKNCHAQEKINLFDIDEVPYVSEPIFSPIWLPPDITDDNK